MKNVIVVNSKDLAEKKKRIMEDGKDRLQILADFDRTLTYASVNGEKVLAVIAILRNSNILSEEYSKAANNLASIYRKIEFDLTIPEKERKEKMKEWWEKHFDLLIKSKLNKKHIEEVIKSNKIRLREGVKELFEISHKNKIPIIILSSAGLGIESIQGVLSKESLLYDNVNIIANSFEWNNNGDAINIKRPIIHSMNKDETSIQEFPNIYKKIKDRKNVILLGDSLGDLGMAKGIDYKNIIKIGFLNEEVEKNLDSYKKSFDILILDDGDMGEVNSLLKEIVK